MKYLAYALVGCVFFLTIHMLVYSEVALLILAVATIWWILEMAEEESIWVYVAATLPATMLAVVETML